jgi:hypothetical protein
MILIQEPLDFHFLFADAVGFIPVHFRFPDMPAWKPHLCQAFQFPPSTSTELPLQAHDTTDAAPDGNRFYFFDLTRASCKTQQNWPSG